MYPRFGIDARKRVAFFRLGPSSLTPFAESATRTRLGAVSRRRPYKHTAKTARLAKHEPCDLFDLPPNRESPVDGVARKLAAQRRCTHPEQKCPLRGECVIGYVPTLPKVATGSSVLSLATPPNPKVRFGSEADVRLPSSQSGWRIAAMGGMRTPETAESELHGLRVTLCQHVIETFTIHGSSTGIGNQCCGHERN